MVEGAPKVATPSTAEQPAPAGKEAPKDKDAPAPSMEGTPQPGKDEKQTTIPGMGDPAPAGKVVDFTAARDGAAKGKPPEKAAAPDKGKQADKAKDAAKPRRGRPPKADKAAPDKAKPQPRDKMSQSKPPAGKGAPAKAEAPAATEQPPAPRDAARGVKEEIVYLNLSDLPNAAIFTVLVPKLRLGLVGGRLVILTGRPLRGLAASFALSACLPLSWAAAFSVGLPFVAPSRVAIKSTTFPVGAGSPMPGIVTC